ncbi:MAG TPA: relaxase domain-containing protein, partial [Opitutaceae bacterium]
MERCTYPFPLAVNSSHHSHYHRFLLGAEPATLAPFPKPYCIGALSGELRRLTENLNLQRWRKLYHGSLPWREGFSPGHYDLGNVAPHCPLPAAYGRPPRRFGAYDFVQIADPSVSALALVAGDKRVLDRFIRLGDDFCAGVEKAAGMRSAGPSGSRTTGRMLAGQFFEPNNRWLMPFLHVHSRVLNFTSFREAPSSLSCIDPRGLARAAEREKSLWIERQADALADLGYRVAPRTGPSHPLCVEGVSARLVATMEAPRIAVLRLLERLITGDRPPSVERLGAELPPEVIATMAEQLESALARSLWQNRPAKVAVPPDGPWRAAVRSHLGLYCPEALAGLDAAASRARAVVSESALFPTPQLDPAHIHAPLHAFLEAASQTPTDPELGAAWHQPQTEQAPSTWLAREFEKALEEVHERLARSGPAD